MSDNKRPKNVRGNNTDNQNINNTRSERQSQNPTNIETEVAPKPSSRTQSEDLDLGRHNGGINRFT